MSRIAPSAPSFTARSRSSAPTSRACGGRITTAAQWKFGDSGTVTALGGVSNSTIPRNSRSPFAVSACPRRVLAMNRFHFSASSTERITPSPSSSRSARASRGSRIGRPPKTSAARAISHLLYWVGLLTICTVMLKYYLSISVGGYIQSTRLGAKRMLQLLVEPIPEGLPALMGSSAAVRESAPPLRALQRSSATHPDTAAEELFRTLTLKFL